MKSPRRRFCIAAGAAALVPARAAAAEPLRIALAPFLSPNALLSLYRPLREHLERSLARPVEMLTAKDFRALAEDARRDTEFDVVQFPAHLARLAMMDWRYEQVGAPTERVTVVVVVRGAGPVRAPADLRERSVGMLDPLSLTATVGRRWLQEQGLAEQVRVSALPSVNSGFYALEREEVAAFVAADTQLQTLPADTPRGERVLARLTDIPGPLFVASPRMPPAALATLRAAMGRFEPDPARPATAANSHFRLIEPARLAKLDPLVAIARQALATR